MNAQSHTHPLLTWLDVERVLKQHTALWSRLPQGIISIDCYADGMEVYCSSDESGVSAWLESIFGQSYQRELKKIKLRIGHSLYPVDIIINSVTSSIQNQGYPLWSEVTYLPTKGAPSDNEQASTLAQIRVPSKWGAGPEVISFHSFKGGVGRTTSLMTFVAACIHESKAPSRKILVIDADLEAPGVSFWLDHVNQPKVSFIQFLEALHYPPSNIEDTLDYFAQELRKTSLNIGGTSRELFILPAAMSLGEIQDMPVSPEHLARNPSNPWVLSDYIHKLGSLLNVDAVFIDLRAGLSELASPIIFDPRIDHFFVTTVAAQSVNGMAEVLRRLFAFNSRLPAEWQEDTRPTVILSMLTKELREIGHYSLTLDTLGAAYPTSDALTPDVQWLEAEFLSTLMSISSVRDALEELQHSTRLYQYAYDWAKSLSLHPSETFNTNPPESHSVQERQELAMRLKKVCEAAEFADSSSNATLLATEPLVNLGKHYIRELPNTLIIGAKGAGKTFTFRQLVRSLSWRNFLTTIDTEFDGSLDADIFPILWSGNIEDTPHGEIKSSQRKMLETINLESNQLLLGSQVSRLIEEALASPPEHWEDFWEHLITQQFGLADVGLVGLNNYLVKKSCNVIFVFDGIEDAFKDTTDQIASSAIQALLRLPSRISELEDRHIGTIVFVRADYVQATIRQNLGQLLQRYQPFRLLWNTESFLRLAYMLSCEAGVFEDHPKSAESLRLEQLKEKLQTLWGKKLGSEKSKEAYSARWVYTALCDLKGNVQARDLVRFLKFTSELEAVRPGTTWSDRVLSPESMRKAIPLCSKEKVAEAKQEIAPLQRWITLMEQSGIKNLKVPFSPEEAKLDTVLLHTLQEIGVIYEDSDDKQGNERLFVPEIYRYGLNFETSAAGRPRTQALLKKNIGTIPL